MHEISYVGVTMAILAKKVSIWAWSKKYMPVAMFTNIGQTRQVIIDLFNLINV